MKLLMKTVVVYQSKSGNTRLMAEEIYEYLGDMDKDIIDIDTDNDIPEADLYFVGFGVHNNNCSMDIVDLFERMEEGKYALFMSSGFLPTDKYKDKVLSNIEVWLPEQCELVDSFMCQGKMERHVLDIMVGKMPHAEEQLKQMYAEGSVHPNNDDMENLQEFVTRIFRDSFEV